MNRSGKKVFLQDAPGLRWIMHNLFAHPLLVLCPPLGEWLHGRTEPD